jgi:hypothetical protein
MGVDGGRREERDDQIVGAVLRGATLEQVAHAYGLTRQRVSQIVRARCPDWDGAERRSVRAAEARQARTDEALDRAAARKLEVVRGNGRPRLWSDAMVLNALRDAAVGGRALSVSGWRKRGLRPSVTVVIARFGSWNAACREAGLIVSPPPVVDPARMSDEELVAAVVEFLADSTLEHTAERGRGGVRAYGSWAAALRRTGAHVPSPSVLRARFGSWSQVKILAVTHLATRSTHRGTIPGSSSSSSGERGDFSGSEQGVEGG